MTTDKARLQRLLRLERVRAIAKQVLVAEAAQAEGTLAQLEALADRTGRLAAGYGTAGSTDGWALAQLARFTGGLHGITLATRSDAAQARLAADTKLAELAVAERRRAAVEDRAEAAARSIARKLEPQALGSRRQTGTGLE